MCASSMLWSGCSAMLVKMEQHVGFKETLGSASDMRQGCETVDSSSVFMITWSRDIRSLTYEEKLRQIILVSSSNNTLTQSTLLNLRK
jgi:hypothetical protein